MIRDGLALTLSLGPDYVAAPPGGAARGRGARGGGGGGAGQSLAATIDTPVREVAVITVNGTRGLAPEPPYTIDITSLLKPGDNDIKIEVGNTAINYASANGLPDFTEAIRQFGAPVL